VREAIKVDPGPANRGRLRAAITRLNEFDRVRSEAMSEANRSPQETIALLEKLLAIRPNYAPAYVQLGMAHAALGDRDQAIADWLAVAKLDPENISGIGRLTRLAFFEGRAADAAELCAQAGRIEPRDADVHSAWGRALLNLERSADAAERFQHALAIDPRHADASEGLSEALRRQGFAEAAIAPAKCAARWTQFRDPGKLLTLADAYVAAGRSAEAGSTLEQAISAAAVTQSDLVPGIQDRLRMLDRGESPSGQPR
jgi:tetratricopeptide (TPR) repeat protein